MILRCPKISHKTRKSNSLSFIENLSQKKPSFDFLCFNFMKLFKTLVKILILCELIFMETANESKFMKWVKRLGARKTFRLLMSKQPERLHKRMKSLQIVLGNDGFICRNSITGLLGISNSTKRISFSFFFFQNQKPFDSLKNFLSCLAPENHIRTLYLEIC